QTIPPSQGDAKLAAVAQTARLAGITLTILLVILLIAAPPGVWRWGVVLSAAWTLLRAPAGPAALFSPATFYRPVAGVLGTSAGSLLVVSILVLVAAGARWRRGARRRWWHVAVAGLLVLAAPYLVRYFGRGIAPPAAVEGRLALATRDAQRLGHEGDAVAVALLERFGQQVTALSQTPPRTAADLYALWVASPLVAEDYPAMLNLWSGGREAQPLAELRLARLDLRPALLSALAQSSPTEPCVERLDGIPGL